MGEGKPKTFRDPISTITGPYSSFLAASRNRWADNMEEEEEDASDLGSSTKSFTCSSSSFDESSAASSSCEEDLVDDASSSSSSSSSSTNGPLYELSDLMATLPIKRGLSKHFQGKSQSFTSLSNVSCLEDLVKKESSSYGRKKIKTCKSYGGGLDVQKKVISKNNKSNSAPRFNKSIVGSPRRPPLIPTKRSVFAISQS